MPRAASLNRSLRGFAQRFLELVAEMEPMVLRRLREVLPAYESAVARDPFFLYRLIGLWPQDRDSPDVRARLEVQLWPRNRAETDEGARAGSELLRWAQRYGIHAAWLLYLAYYRLEQWRTGDRALDDFSPLVIPQGDAAPIAFTPAAPLPSESPAAYAARVGKAFKNALHAYLAGGRDETEVTWDKRYIDRRLRQLVRFRVVGDGTGETYEQIAQGPEGGHLRSVQRGIRTMTQLLALPPHTRRPPKK